jgi:hypothetical protein
MSIIESSSSKVTFQCDECNRPPETYLGDFMKALGSAKADGWRCFKDSTGTWCHKCPDCAKEL